MDEQADPMTPDGGRAAAEDGSEEVFTSEEDLRAVTIGELRPLDGQIELLPYQPDWPALYAREEVRIRSALGGTIVRLEHVGSTSVPGLAAKPIIDILLVVPDSSHEPAYVPDLEASGYMLRIREPNWFEHRMFSGPDTSVNLHVFSPGAAEINRMLAFRDHLRTDEADRHVYESAKLDLARLDWEYVQHYADAKTGVVTAIMARALASGAAPSSEEAEPPT
jgi:GrpB-like predicted nucleotidyltransferase (UPF0157 family)